MMLSKSSKEAVVVGIEAGLERGDLMIGSFRCHAQALMHGGNISEIFSELCGRSSGLSAGKGGSCHLYTNTFFGGNGIVGAQVPLGVGLAMKLKYRDEKNIAVALYGDGASNQGQVFEAYNIAKLWHLPVLFVCENNKYGMGTENYRSSASTDYYKRAEFIPGIWVDGMDVLSVRQATEYARDYCLSGKGPLVMEAQTYRYHGHSVLDTGSTYRTQDEVQSVQKRHDPIKHFQSQCISAGLVTQNEADELEKKAVNIVKEAYNNVKKEPIPELSDIYANIYSKNPSNFNVRNCEPRKVTKSARN